MSSKLWDQITVAWLLFSVVFGAVVTALAVYEAFQWHRLVEASPGGDNAMEFLFIGSLFGSALATALLLGMLYISLSGLFDTLRCAKGTEPPPEPPRNPSRPVSSPPPRKDN